MIGLGCWLVETGIRGGQRIRICGDEARVVAATAPVQRARRRGSRRSGVRGHPPRTDDATAAGILKALSAGTSALQNAEGLVDVMPELLRRLGSAVDVSRAYLFDV